MIEIGQFALDLVINLLASVIYDGVSVKTLPFFERRRIESRIEDATAEAVEPLLPFLAQEKIPEDKQRRLLETCVNELRPLTENPERLFQGSLDGQKIYEELYAEHELPQVIVEDDLKEIYALLCPRIATLLCKIPAAVKDWESEAWSENYRRLDDISVQMRKLFTSVDELATSPSRQADEMLLIVRRALAQKVRLQLDLTGLRADRPLEGRFDDFFVHPEIKEVTDDDKNSRVIETQDDSFATFTQPYSRTIIIGAAGAGKSTWTKWLQRESLTSRWSGICIRVELRRFAREELPSLHELVRETVGKHLAEELSAERIGHWLKAHEAIFILDGFDEIRPSERDSVYDWISDLAFASQGCPIVLTSRVLTTEHLGELRSAGWHMWSIESFDEARIIDYIERWHTHTPLLQADSTTIDAAKLARDWRGDPTIEPLTGNPLLLSTLLMVHHLDGSLPNGRSQLYQRYVAGMLGLWDDRRNVVAASVTLTPMQKQQIIRGFALKLFFEEQDQLDETDALDWLGEFLDLMKVNCSANDVLDMLRERSGLVIGPGIYSFAHKSIAEYLVAEVILQGDQRDDNGTKIDRFSLFEHRDEDRWNTITFLWAGLAPIADVQSFIKACIKVRNWELAYGILLDQYERISSKNRRTLILQYNDFTNLTDFEGPLYGRQVSGPAKMFEAALGIMGWIGIPTLRLRNLGGIPLLSNLLHRALDDGTIVQDDLNITQGNLREHLWIINSSMVSDMNSWKTYLELPTPSTVSQSMWLFMAACYSFRNALDENMGYLESIIASFQEACPQVGGLVPLVLVSIWLELAQDTKGMEDPKIRKKLNLILDILPDSDNGNMIPEWLLESRTWIRAQMGGISGIAIGDVLITFSQELTSFAHEGFVEREEAYKQTIDYVHELQNRREKLVD